MLSQFSQSSYSPFPSLDAVYFSQSVDIVQTKSFSLQSTIPPWLCHLFFADLYCLRVIVTGGGQRTTCKQQHRERPCRLLWQRECAQRSALCFVPTVICQRRFIYRASKVTLDVFPFYFPSVLMLSFFLRVNDHPS